jgi:uncharacterized protein YkwD
MEFACRDHVDDTAPTGVIGNNGTDGSEPIDRIKRYGLVDTYVD